MREKDKILDNLRMPSGYIADETHHLYAIVELIADIRDILNKRN